MVSSRLLRGISVIACVFMLAACQNEKGGGSTRHLAPIPAKTLALMEEKGTKPSEPMVVRIFKKEEKLEVWKRRTADQKYVLLKTYPICAWSGQLGPKQREGDRQAPEGFYTITPGLMNPNSSYHLAFNLGYPNAFDRAHGRTGSHLMVHGACTSRGCYAMEDEQISEIYAMGRESFRGGQRNFQVQAYPFRMTPQNMAKYRNNEHMPFWKNLKQGYDSFELTRAEPVVGVCNRKYVFNATSADGSPLSASAPCPELKTDPAFASALAAKQKQDEAEIQTLVAQGVAPVTDITEQERKTLVAQRRNNRGVDPAASEPVQVASATTPARQVARAAEAAAPVTTASLPAAPISRPGSATQTAPAGGTFGWLRGISAPKAEAAVSVSQEPAEASPKPSLTAAAPHSVPLPVPNPIQGTYVAPRISAVSPAATSVTEGEPTVSSTLQAQPDEPQPRRSPISTVFSVFQ